MNSNPFLQAVERELARAQAKHPPLHSLHEAYAVILEEVDELKAEVWKQSAARNTENLYQELVQIAAMCARAALDCGYLPAGTEEDDPGHPCRAELPASTH